VIIAILITPLKHICKKAAKPQREGFAQKQPFRLTKRLTSAPATRHSSSNWCRDLSQGGHTQYLAAGFLLTCNRCKSILYPAQSKFLSNQTSKTKSKNIKNLLIFISDLPSQN